MNIVIVTNSTKYKYHDLLAEDIKTVLESDCVTGCMHVLGKEADAVNSGSMPDIEIYNLSTEKSGFEHYAAISAMQIDIMITLDATGFDILTSGGTLAYNGLTCKCIHLLFQNENIYKNELKLRQNLSMQTVFVNGEDGAGAVESNSGLAGRLMYKAEDVITREANRKYFEELLTKTIAEITFLKNINEDVTEDVLSEVKTSNNESSNVNNSCNRTSTDVITQINKILIFEWGTGSITHEDVLNAFKNKGYECNVLSYMFADVNNDDYFVNRFKCELKKDCYEFVYSTNYFPLVAKCCEAAGIKYISWSYDAPLNVPDIEKTLGFKCNKVYLYDRLMVQEYNDKGFDNVHHLPLSVNVDRLDKIKITDNDIKKYSADISFVGQLYQSQMPLIMSAIDEYHRGFLEAVMKAQSKIYGYFIIDDVLKPEFMDKLNEIAAFPISKEALSYAMSAQVTRDERLLFLKLLSNHYDVKLYSSENNELLSNATFMGTVGYMNEMPKVFKLSKINLNMSLRCIKSGIPLRALDIMGAGGFLMSNYQPELAEYFIDGEDYVMYESIEDMYAKVDFYLKNDELRQAIARNGHDKLKELFDYDSRIEAMLSEGV